MAITIEELRQGMNLRKGPDGELLTVPVQIHGLIKDVGTNSATAIMQQASLALDQNGYAMYAPHKRVTGSTFSAYKPGFLLVNQDIKPFLDANDKAQAVLTYRNFNYLVIKIDGATYRETTRFNTKGELLQVGYAAGEPPDTDVVFKAAELDFDVDVDYPEQPVLRPQLTLELQFVYPVAYQWAKTFQSRINKTKWQGGAPHTWQCMRFAVEPIDSWGRSQLCYVDTLFQFKGFAGPTKNLDSYDPVFVYTRLETGRPTGGITPKPTQLSATKPFKRANGWSQEMVQFETDFAVGPLAKLPVIFYQ